MNQDSLINHKSYKWYVVAMLSLICFLNYADRQVISGIFPVLEQEFHFSKFQLGLIGSSFMWLYAAFSLVAGFFADRFPRKRLILGGCLFWSLVTITTAWCAKLWQFIAVRALEGIGESLYFPSSMSLMADYHGKRTRSTAMSLHQFGVYFGTIAGSWMGAWFAQHYGWRIGFYFFGSLGIFVSIILFFFLREQKRGAMEKEQESLHSCHDTPTEEISLHAFEPLGIKATFHYLLKKPVALLLMTAFACANFVGMIFLVWMPTFLYEKFHLSLVFAGFSGVVFIEVASIVGSPMAGLLADRFSAKWKNGRVIVQLLCLLLGIVTIIAVGTLKNFIPLMVALSLFGICKSGYGAGIFASLFDYVEPHVRGAAAGFMNTAGWIGGALGPIVVGAVSTYGHGSAISCMSAAISWSAGMYLVGACFLVVVLVVASRRMN